jgi:hypothetical protein
MKKIIGLFCKQQTLPLLTAQVLTQTEVRQKAAANRFRNAVRELKEASIELRTEGGACILYSGPSNTFVGGSWYTLSSLIIPKGIEFSKAPDVY